MKFKTLIPFTSILLFFSCSTSVEPRASKEVLITVWNECSCRITFYRDGHFYLTDDYDCEYLKTLPAYLDEGTYQVVAENGFGQVVELEFVKHYHSEELSIEF